MKNECIHKEILLSRYIVRDIVTNKIFEMCPKCYREIMHLAGFQLIENGNAPIINQIKNFDQENSIKGKF